MRQWPRIHSASWAGVTWLAVRLCRTPRESRAQAPAPGDSNFANFLWDGHGVRMVDFEDSGPSDRAFELALLVEHVSAWSDAQLAADTFLALFDLTTVERTRLLQFRRLAALFWLTLLRPGSHSSRRSLPGTHNRQADRLLSLLG